MRKYKISIIFKKYVDKHERSADSFDIGNSGNLNFYMNDRIVESYASGVWLSVFEMDSDK